MATTATTEFIPAASVGCWSVFYGIHTPMERARERRYRCAERLAILLDGAAVLPTDEQMEIAVNEAVEMEHKMKVWLV